MTSQKEFKMEINKLRMILAHMVTKRIMALETLKTSYRENFSMILKELHKLDQERLWWWYLAFKQSIVSRKLMFFKDVLGFDFRRYEKHEWEVKKEMQRKAWAEKKAIKSAKSYSPKYFTAKYAGRDIETGEQFEAGQLIFRNGYGYSLADNY